MNRFSILFILLVAIVSCKKFEDISVNMKNGELYFSSDEIVSVCVVGLFITNFGIEYIGDSVSKSAWTIVRETMPTVEDKAFDFPLQYGENKAGISVRSPAIKIEPGNYNFGGTIFCIKDDGETGFDVAGKFVINQDGSLKSR